MQTIKPLLPNWTSLRYSSSSIFFIAMIMIPLLLLGGSSALYGQTTIQQFPPKPDDLDSVNLRINNLPELQPLIADSIITPYYNFLWIFSDGGFINGTPDSELKYRYRPTGANQSGRTAAYSTGFYSTKGKRPPRLDADIDIFNTTNAVEYQPTLTVGPDSVLNLQRNHLGLVPNDTTVWIFSVRNPSKSDNWSGQLYLFYESPIEEEFVSAPLTEDDLLLGFGEVLVEQPAQIARFQLDTAMVFFPNMDNTTYLIDSLKAGQIASKFKKAAVWNIFNLNPGQEKRVFVQFKNDPNIFSKFDPKAKGKVRFLGMFLGENNPQNPNQVFPSLTPEDQELAEEFGLNGFIESLSIYSDIDTSFESSFALPYSAFYNEFGGSSGNIGTSIVDIFEGEIYAAKGHDPNQIEALSCKCPAGNSDQQKVLLTIDFVNTGTAPTDSIFIEMPVPNGIDINSLNSLPLSTDPIIPDSLNPADYIELEIDEVNRVIKWSLNNFKLGPTAERGIGHPDTEGQIVFYMLTETGVDINDIDPFYACIRFFETDDPVCTIPANITPVIQNPTAPVGEQEFLTCNKCPDSTIPPNTIPWWIWLIIILALLLCAYVVYDNM
jgi:hypothetical protein